MVVDDFDVIGVAASPKKADPPLIVDPNAMLSFAISGKALQPVAGWDSGVTAWFRGAVRLPDGAVWKEPVPARVRLARSSRDCPQSLRATSRGSIPAAFHQPRSLPTRCSARWWLRQSGTTNSSLTLRPSARAWAKRRWCGSEGVRPQNEAGLPGDHLGELDGRRHGLSCIRTFRHLGHRVKLDTGGAAHHQHFVQL